MNILAVNSSDDRLSVALNCDSEVLQIERQAKREHNRFVLNMIQRLLADSDLSLSQMDAVAFGDGPGSFTGLRISAAVAQGIAFGIDAPVIPVSCMAAIAQSQDAPKVLVAMDAKKNTVHWAKYVLNAGKIVELDGEEQLTPITECVVVGTHWCGAGSGWDAHASVLAEQNLMSIERWNALQLPGAHSIAVLGLGYYRQGKARDAVQAIPKYRFPYVTG